MSTQQEHAVRPPKTEFHGCYLLISRSEEHRFAGKTYIGYTVDPVRRIRQHNEGRKGGGAKQTENRGPWEMLLVVHGFLNEKSGLRFEWAWQKPMKSRRLKCKGLKKKAKESHAQFRLRVLCEMLQTPPWNRLPLTIQQLSVNQLEFPKDHKFPGHIRLRTGPIHLQDYNTNPVSLPAICISCEEEITSVEDWVHCPETNCAGTFHMCCLAQVLLGASTFLIPISGLCPSCEHHIFWTDVVQYRRKQMLN